MMRLKHEFTKFIPKQLQDGIIYISCEYKSARHMCCCGCGTQVVTPLSPTKWKFTFDGESISLYPSIGRWNSKCQSHYWIKNSNVIWDAKLSKEEINEVKIKDQSDTTKFYNERLKPESHLNGVLKAKGDRIIGKISLFDRLKAWLKSF